MSYTPLGMIDHIGFAVSSAERSKAFYEKVLKPLGFACNANFDGWFGFGIGDKSELWFGEDEKGSQSPMHIAFKAESREQVDLFYKAAIESGAKDNGEPGLRSYHENYYGAFVLDPDGHNIEAVFHEPV